MTSAPTSLRRGAGTVALLSALLLALSALLLAPPALAEDPGTPCNELGYEKPANLDTGSGTADFEWGTITWGGHGDEADNELVYDIEDGFAVEFCLKGGNTEPTESGLKVGSGSVIHTTNPDISHVGFRVTELVDVTLVKVWQDADGNSTTAPEGVTWEATLTLAEGSIGDDLAVSDTAGSTDSTMTVDGTTYTVAEDDSSEAFDEAACSEAVQSEIAGTHGDANAIAYGTGAGAVDGDTVHVVCNTVPEPIIEPTTWDLTVEKDVVGDAGDAASFSFLVTCGDAPAQTLTIADGGSDSVTDIAEDTSCTVAEQDVPEDATVTITTSEDSTVVDGSSISLAARSTDITVSFVNTFEEEDETVVDDDEVVRPSTPDELDEPDEPDEVEVLPNVVEKPAPTPAPTPAPAVAAQELPATGLSSTQMLLLALLLMGLGAVMILGPEGRREY